MQNNNAKLKDRSHRRKLYRFEVDQSVKIEQLNQDTILGVANKKMSISYVISRKTKRHFNEYFRRQGQPKKCAPTIFAAAIVIALKKEKINPGSLVIDTEYNRYEKLIRSFIEGFFSQTVVSLQRVGKNSPAHVVAYYVHTGRIKPNGVITRYDIMEALETKKTAGELQHLEFTRIRKSNRPVAIKHSLRELNVKKIKRKKL